MRKKNYPSQAERLSEATNLVYEVYKEMMHGNVEDCKSQADELRGTVEAMFWSVFNSTPEGRW